jgi:hypothetical protein
MGRDVWYMSQSQNREIDSDDGTTPPPQPPGTQHMCMNLRFGARNHTTQNKESTDGACKVQFRFIN